MIFINFKKKSRYLARIFIINSKDYKSKTLISLSKILDFELFLLYYELFFLISLRASLPSLRVLRTSQEREEIITIVSVNREMVVESILKAIKLTFVRSLNFHT